MSGHAIMMLAPHACRIHAITIHAAIREHSIIEFLALLAFNTFQILPVSFLSYRFCVFETFV
jgi:hypothetical protein